MIVLGKLERVDIRHVWQREAKNFTPWLAQEENLQMLGETLHMDLVLEAQEKNVGTFRADILAKDTVTENWVLIENQLEETDHRHLGQIITYASGIRANTVVWIAQTFTSEHRSAIDWLNEMTNECLRFFAVELEVWRIGTSQFAPKFNVISKPNDWAKTVENVVRSESTNRYISEGADRYASDFADLIEILYRQNPSIGPAEMARQADCSYNTAKKWLERLRIKPNNAG